MHLVVAGSIVVEISESEEETKVFNTYTFNTKQIINYHGRNNTRRGK